MLTHFSLLGSSGLLLLLGYQFFVTPATIASASVIPMEAPLSDKALLDKVQEASFRYFWDFAHPTSGLAPERTTTPNVVTSGGSGFGVSAIVIATHRQWISRTDAVARLLKITRFLEKSDRFHGAWSHWLDGTTGKVIPFSPKDDGGDLVETSYLVNGLLVARAYFNGNTAEETELRQRITQLWETVEWDWYAHNGLLHWHWSPNNGWGMNMPIRGYNECLITYVLAEASPTHAISAETYEKTWKSSTNFLNGKSYEGYKLDLGFPYGGPLFFAHYSFLGLDPRQMQDAHTNYWQQNVKHTLINRAYCVKSAPAENRYSVNNWGLTASDNYEFYGAHQPAEDNGTISPTAALSSFPYTPYYSMQALRYFYEQVGTRLWGKYGFYDAFALKKDWFDTQYLAIDQGPIAVMIENYRSGLCWNLFTQLPEIQSGLLKMKINKPNYTTGFYSAIPENICHCLDLMKNPDYGKYQTEVYIAEPQVKATLELTDAQGKLVKVLWKGQLSKPGMQACQFEAAPGNYQLRLTAGSKTEKLLVNLH
jgi:hypothetical protein